jgi:competence protein ComEC
MFYNKRVLPLYFLLIVLIISACSKKEATQSSFNRNPIYSEKDLLIHYIDVGQGDAILLQINNKNLLIDSGPESSSEKVTRYLKEQRVKQLDVVLATHPHEDHIGSMDSIINSYKILEFYAPKKTASSKCFESMIKALKNKGLKINIAKAGIALNLGNNISADILSPITTNYDETNNYSAVLKVTYGSTKFLFMGDGETLVENELIASKQDLSANIIKLGHHGSKSSSSLTFLNKVSPSYAIISCGKGNDYGHPHKETLSNLKLKEITTYRTDLNKDILFKSDGTSIIKLK